MAVSLALSSGVLGRNVLPTGGNSTFEAQIVGYHSSKSTRIPIFAAESPDSNVKITWFSHNWYFIFMGVEFARPVNAVLMYPISGIFGSYPLSGHVNTEIAPPIDNFQRLYHNRNSVKRFGADLGSSNMNPALVVRFLDLVSNIRIRRLLNIILYKTKYGKLDSIDGNAIEFDDLTDVLGLKRLGDFAPYDFDVDLQYRGIFESIKIDWYDLKLDGSGVWITLQPNRILPQLPLPRGSLYLDPSDTLLAKHLPVSVQANPLTNPNLQPNILSLVKARTLNWYKKELADEQYLEGAGYPFNQEAYYGGSSHLRRVYIHTPNPLDAATVALFLSQVVAPFLENIQ